MRKSNEAGKKVNNMTRQEIIEYCLTLPGTFEDYPFDNLSKSPVSWTVMRLKVNKKSFALIYERNGRLCVNLKCDPMEADFLRGVYQDVFPAYHMNKTHWNTVAIGGDVPDQELTNMILGSYDLVKPKLRAHNRMVSDKTWPMRRYLSSAFQVPQQFLQESIPKPR